MITDTTVNDTACQHHTAVTWDKHRLAEPTLHNPTLPNPTHIELSGLSSKVNSLGSMHIPAMLIPTSDATPHANMWTRAASASSGSQALPMRFWNHE